MLDRGVVLRSGDTGDVVRLRRAPFFFLFPLFSLGLGVLWMTTKWQRGDESSGAPGARAFIVELHGTHGGW